MSSQAVAPVTFEGQSRWAENLAGARAALAEVTPRLLAMLRSVQRPDAIAVGEWTVADVATHLSHVAVGETIVARSVGEPSPEGLPVGDDIITTAAQFNATSLAGDPERDLSVLADRIEQGVSDFIDAMSAVRGNEGVTWLGGVILPSSALACHLLEEITVHGFDIARAEDTSWPIASDHASLAVGFLFDLMRFCEPKMRRAFVDQDAATGVRACYDFRVRGGRRDFLIIEDGLVTIEEPSSRRVDCHISADPEVALLLGMGRIGRIRPALTGRLTAWGRRPWLAFKMGSLLKNA